MRDPKATRRDFLLAIGALTGAGSVGLLGCGTPASDAPAPDPGTPPGDPGPAGGVLVRRSITDPQSSLEAYRAAVAVMQGRPASDPTSWQAQALIHQNFCPHGNAFFLPWHRAYLRYFEEICRAASGDANFALPYWDWTADPAIPDSFWTGDLNHPRSIQQGVPIGSQFVGAPTIDGILAINDFETFASAYVGTGCTSGVSCQRQGAGTGELEGVPHNNVHRLIGGDMGTFMSPLDPIFWMHHCNVDRLWVEWNKTHANGVNAEWRSFLFENNFVDAAGVPQTMSVESTFSTFALGYRYDTQPEVGLEAATMATDANIVASAMTESTATAQVGQALHIPVSLPAEVRSAMQSASSPLEAAGNSTVRLVLDGVTNPGAAVGVNLFIGASGAPSGIDTPNYVRTFGFFPTSGEHADHARTFLFDIGDDLKRLGDGWDTGGDLPVHLETVPLGAGMEAAVAGAAPASVRIEIVQH